MGTTTGGEAVITKGLAAGEQVVREGQFLLGPGSRIEIKETAVSERKEEIQRSRTKSKAKAIKKGASHEHLGAFHTQAGDDHPRHVREY